VEVLASSRVLYLPTAVRTTLLELVDGSGAPDLNSLLNVIPPAASVTVLSFGCGGGHNLRQGAGAPPNAPDLAKNHRIWSRIRHPEHAAINELGRSLTPAFNAGHLGRRAPHIPSMPGFGRASID
jgi:hypothetical protein